MLRSQYIRVHFNPFPTERILLLRYLWWWGHVTSPQSRLLHGGWMSKTVKSCCPNTAWNYCKQSLLEMCMRFHAMKAPAANSNAIYLRSCGNLRPKEQTHMRKENLECFQEACHTTLRTMVRSMIFDKKGEVQPPNVQIQTSLTHSSHHSPPHITQGMCWVGDFQKFRVWFDNVALQLPSLSAMATFSSLNDSIASSLRALCEEVVSKAATPWVMIGSWKFTASSPLKLETHPG